MALVHERHVHVFAGDRLHGAGEALDLGATVGIGRGDVEGQQVVERVHRHVELGALLPLGPFPGSGFASPRTGYNGAGAALGRSLPRFRRCVASVESRRRGGAQGPAVEHDRARLRFATDRQAQHRPEIVHQRLEAPGRQPALRLLVHRPFAAIPPMLRIAGTLSGSAQGGRSLGAHRHGAPAFTM